MNNRTRLFSLFFGVGCLFFILYQNNVTLPPILMATCLAGAKKSSLSAARPFWHALLCKNANELIIGAPDTTGCLPRIVKQFVRFKVYFGHFCLQQNISPMCSIVNVVH